MQLTVKKRAEKSKARINQIRREGMIPAIMYSSGNTGTALEVDGPGFHAAMRAIKPGMLSTTIFTLDFENKKTKVIVKDIQYDVTSYDVIHLDFEELKDNTPVKVNVPVHCIGTADSPGIKLGGALRQITRKIKVTCLPENIPADFEVDVSQMALGQKIRLSDIAMPKGVTPLKKDEVIVVIAKQ